MCGRYIYKLTWQRILDLYRLTLAAIKHSKSARGLMHLLTRVILALGIPGGFSVSVNLEGGRCLRFVAETNQNPKPFVWTKNPDKIIAAVRRRHQMLDSVH